MKKTLFLSLALLFASTALDARFCKSADDSQCPVMKYSRAFAEGAVAGAATSITFDWVRAYVLPDISSLDLYGNYGVCRDQLSGFAKLFAATTILSQLCCEKAQDLTTSAARFAGIIAGYAASCYVKKELFTAAPAAAPAPTACCPAPVASAPAVVS